MSYLNHPVEVEKCMEILSDTGQKLALRDAVLVSACDGDYDKKVYNQENCKIAGVDNDALSKYTNR